MKKFETPVMNVEKFDFENVVTLSDAVATAKAQLNKMGIAEENTFVITL